MVSQEARSIRQQLSAVIADVLYQWMLRFLPKAVQVSPLTSQVQLASGSNINIGRDSRLQSIDDYQSFLKDRRVKVIFFKILDSARKDPVLMLRFYWTSFVMIATVSVLACTKVLVTLFEASVPGSSFNPKQIAAGV